MTTSLQQQCLYFVLGHEKFALPMTAVKELIRIPELIRVPLAGKHLIGVTNLRGLVLPLISLASLLGRPAAEPSETSRILVLKGDQPLGLWVDEVEAVEAFLSEQLDTSDALQRDDQRRYLTGLIRPAADQPKQGVRRLLNAAALQEASSLHPAHQKEARQTQMPVEHSSQTQNATEDTKQLIIGFELGTQAFALAIQQIKEVVRFPQHLEEVTGLPSFILGVMPLRELLVPLISLHRLYGLAENQATSHQRRVVLVPLGERNGSRFVGLVVDAISQVSSLPAQAFQPVPELLASLPGFQDVNAIARISADEKLLALLDSRKLLAGKQLHEVAETAHQEIEMNSVVVEEERQLVVFLLDQEEYGVPIEAAKEILRLPEQLTRVPKSPAFIEGVINLRGLVLPVIDLRRRFDLPLQTPDSKQRIIVLNLAGQLTGFIVDSVKEVLKVEDKQIEPAPPLSSEQMQLIRQMANITQQNRMILLLDVAQLINDQEAKQLTHLDENAAADVAEGKVQA